VTGWQPSDEQLVVHALSTVVVRDVGGGDLHADAQARQARAVLAILAEHGRLVGGQDRPWHLEYWEPVRERWVELSAHPSRHAVEAHASLVDAMFNRGTRLRVLDPHGEPVSHYGPAGAAA
jgi:hypothetical protein